MFTVYMEIFIVAHVPIHSDPLLGAHTFGSSTMTHTSKIAKAGKQLGM